MHTVATDNCESGIPGMDEPHAHSLRWHAVKDGRTFIVYADTLEEAVGIFVKSGLVEGSIVRPSGYYCQRANAIYRAGDGPTSLLDNSNGRLT